MIRLTLLLLAGLVSVMVIWGREAPEMRAAAMSVDIQAEPLGDPVGEAAKTVIEVADVQPVAQPATVEPAPAAEVTQLDSIDLTSPKPASSLLVFEASDAPPEAAKPVVVPDNAKLLVVTGSSVNMRAGPSTARDVVGKLRRGDKAELVTEAADGWFQVRALANGKVGFMSGDFLTVAN